MREETADPVKKYKNRNSSIELMKIIAILMIVLSHSIPDGRGVINISKATTDPQIFIAGLMTNLGQIGNCIFLTSSAWFLVNSKSVKGVKILFIIADCFLISVGWLSIFLLNHYDLPLRIIIKQFFPVTFGNSWFVTCYLLLYVIHPLLNKLIDSVSKEVLLLTNVSYILLYCGLSFLMKRNLFCYNRLIGFIGIYFIIAYIKKYMNKTMSSIRLNVVLFLLGFIGWIGMAFFTNYCGLHVSALSEELQRWNTFINPCFLLMAIGAFNMARQREYHNRIINYISSLSLLIYIIHANRLIRDYLRFDVYLAIKEKYTLEHLLLWILLYAAISFVGATLIAVVYERTLKKPIRKLCDIIGDRIRKLYGKASKALLRLE